jgi:hypothetical protein
MANHKRRRPKNRRAGCLLCKPHKQNGWGKGRFNSVGVGFGKFRKLYAAMREQQEA